MIEFMLNLNRMHLVSGDKFKLRWFTPTNEVALCGHATLASAAVLMFSYGKIGTHVLITDGKTCDLAAIMLSS